MVQNPSAHQIERGEDLGQDMARTGDGVGFDQDRRAIGLANHPRIARGSMACRPPDAAAV